MKRFLALPCLILMLSGCASLQKAAPLGQVSQDSGYRYDNLKGGDNSESLLVILTFSGGGTRAMAMSYGVLEELRDTPIEWEGRSKRMLDEVDVISSVSGGSFTAAYYGLYLDRLFEDFGEKALYKNLQAELIKRVFTPPGLLRMTFHLSRTDIADRYYDKHIFGGATFADFPDTRPFIILNATDMIEGTRFEFTQNQFDPLCLDLDEFRVSRAVTASSTYPLIFRPMRLENHAGDCGYSPPDWVPQAIEKRNMNSGWFDRAKVMESYQDVTERPTIRLMDGGTSDTLALHGPYNALSSTDISWSLLDDINRGEIKKVAVIVVNATTRTEMENKGGTLSSLGLFQSWNVAATSLLRNYSAITLDQLHDLFEDWRVRSERYEALKDCPESGKCVQEVYPEGAQPNLDLYMIHLRFDSLPDERDREYFNNVGGGLHLSREEVDRVRAVARELLRSSPQYQALLESLGKRK